MLVAVLAFLAGGFIAEPLAALGILPMVLFLVGTVWSSFLPPTEECWKKTHIFPRPPR